MEDDFVRVAEHGQQDTSSTVIRLRCPRCKQQGVFEPLSPNDARVDEVGGGVSIVGVRRCPSADCLTLVLFRRRPDGTVVAYPPERIDFDSTNLPPGVLSSLTEAIACHGNGCYRAATMMVRRTLEELCDHQDAEGDDLKERLKALRGQVVLPEALLDGLDELRFLGNDASHVEARLYDDIGKDEAELAIDVTKEVLKGVYQYDDLIARLRARQRPTEDDG